MRLRANVIAKVSKSFPLFGASTALLALLIACQGQPESNKKKEDKAGGANAGATSPTASPAASPDASASPVPGSSAACEDQWKQHVAKFKVGAKVSYTSTMTYTVLFMPKTVPLVHTEEVIASSDEQVDRSVTLTSNDPEVGSMLSLFKLTPKITLKKVNFVTTCAKAQNIGSSTVAFGGGNVQVLENRDETITVSGQQVSARYMKLKANVDSVQAFAVNADIQVWLSKDTPGLVLKQNSILNNVPISGVVNFTDELASQSGM